MPDEVKVTTLKLVLTKTPKNWMPEGGNDWRDIVPKYTATIQPKGIKGKMKFSLQHVTNYTGYCSNAGDSTEKDLRFIKPNQKGFKYNNDGSVVETDEEVNSAEIIIQCNDYGAYGELKAETVTHIPTRDRLSI